MATLYVTSSQKITGKTLVSAGLGKHLQNDGKKVGFLKPIVADDKGQASPEAKNDATFMKKILALAESIDETSPIISMTTEYLAMSQIRTNKRRRRNPPPVDLFLGIFINRASTSRQGVH